MRICIPIEFKAEGGGFYFLQLFENFLQDNGWEVTRDVGDKFEVLFTNHWMTPREQILRAIRSNPGVRIVHRIDGVAQDYGRDVEADRRQARVNQLADLTIFQSQYARYAAREKFSVVSQDGPVIHNPVDVNVFTPAGEKSKINANWQIICVSWSTNPLKGAAKIYAVAEANPDVDFALCGNFPGSPNLANLRGLGVLNRSDLAAAYRSSQILLTFSKNEACPNHVLEALASGLPVLYTDSGAMSELIAECGAPVSVDNFRVQVNAVLAGLQGLSAKARQRALQFFRPETVFPKYVRAIEDLLQKPTRLSKAFRLALAWSGLGIE